LNTFDIFLVLEGRVHVFQICIELLSLSFSCSSSEYNLQCNAGVFLAISSNTRYQIVNGLERLVESSPLAKRVPPIALGFTVGVRFANNIYGGMQFVDWARWTGIQ